MKKLRLFASTAVLSAIMSMNAFAGQWVQDNVGWWYQNDDGTYPTSQWYSENNKWYYFNKDGYMVIGWLHLTNSDEYYYFNPDGSMRTDPLEENGYTYTFDASGKCTNRPEDQIQSLYNSEVLRLEVRNSYYNPNDNSNTRYGGMLSNENIVSYHDVAQDK